MGAAMITRQQLTREIELTTESMQNANADEHDYLVGRLAALLWVQGGGELLRRDAYQQAVDAWYAQRAGKEVRP